MNMAAEAPARAGLEQEVVLKPLSLPGLPEIRIEDDLFPVGRNEFPFASWGREAVAGLSRRHARLFAEKGGVWVADLGSKNGTAVNRVPVDKPVRLRAGDEVCFGGALSFRVEFSPRQGGAARPARLLSLALVPERENLGLQPIVVSSFPFLVSKTDEAFARYREAWPEQVNYLSRRHAHLFLKGNRPWLEDLGSTNGSFVDDQRLEEHAVPLEDGSLVAFGGRHFVYRVRLERGGEAEPTLTTFASGPTGERESFFSADKTTFVASADSFLDIFCIDRGAAAEDEVNKEIPAEGRERGRLGMLVAEIRRALGNGSGEATAPSARRLPAWGLALGVLIGFGAVTYFLRGAPEREMRGLLAEGDYGRAAEAGDGLLARNPDNPALRALDTEALLKAHVPGWIARLKARDFDGAATVLASMGRLAAHNPEARGLLAELEWIGRLESFVGRRGGVEAPIHIFHDEAAITALLAGWSDDTAEHQRIFSAISAQVPEFGDRYAEALSHLRKLQSDEAVYLAAIERLKATLATELDQGHPEALESVLKDYGEKYPRLGGLDLLRQDLTRYQEALAAAKAGQLARFQADPEKARFATPPFREKFKALAANPPAPAPGAAGADRPGAQP